MQRRDQRIGLAGQKRIDRTMVTLPPYAGERGDRLIDDVELPLIASFPDLGFRKCREGDEAPLQRISQHRLPEWAAEIPHIGDALFQHLSALAFAVGWHAPRHDIASDHTIIVADDHAGLFGPDVGGERGVGLPNIEPCIVPPTGNLVGVGSIVIAHTGSLAIANSIASLLRRS